MSITEVTGNASCRQITTQKGLLPAGGLVLGHDVGRRRSPRRHYNQPCGRTTVHVRCCPPEPEHTENPGPSLDGRGSITAPLVELARRYSNLPTVLSDMTRTWRELRREVGATATSNDTLVLRSATRHPGRPYALSRRLAPEVVEAIIADYRTGSTCVELARRYKISKTSVLGLLDSHDIERRHQPMTLEQIAEAALLYESGLSVAAVGLRLGIPPRTVHRTLTREGVPMRDRHGRPPPAA